jgi:hypothetical protein
LLAKVFDVAAGVVDAVAINVVVVDKLLAKIPAAAPPPLAVIVGPTRGGVTVVHLIPPRMLWSDGDGGSFIGVDG